MPHVKIELLYVDFLEPQMDANEKQICLIGAFATKDIIKTVMTILEIKRGNKTFNREQIVLFEGTVSLGEKVKVLLIVHDEEARKSFSNYQEVVNQINTTAGSALSEAKAQRVVHTSATSQVASATNTLMSLEKDNLAYQTFEIDADGSTVEELNLKIKSGNSLDSTWCYTAQYRIVRS